jgi:hypothetical protein
LGIVIAPVDLFMLSDGYGRPAEYRSIVKAAESCEIDHCDNEFTLIAMSVAAADDELMTIPFVVVDALAMFPDNTALSIFTKSVLVTYPPLPLLTILGEITCCSMFLTVEVVA